MKYKWHYCKASAAQNSYNFLTELGIKQLRSSGLLSFVMMTTDVAPTVVSLEATTSAYDRSQGTTSELVNISPSPWTGRPIVNVSGTCRTACNSTLTSPRFWRSEQPPSCKLPRQPCPQYLLPEPTSPFQTRWRSLAWYWTAVCRSTATYYYYYFLNLKPSSVKIPRVKIINIIIIILIFTSFFSFITNLGMLICLVVYKQAARKRVNILSAIRQFSTSSSRSSRAALQMSGYLHSKTDVLKTFMTTLEVKRRWLQYLSLILFLCV